MIMLLFYSLFKISLEKRSRYYIVVLLILFYLIWYLQSGRRWRYWPSRS